MTRWTGLLVMALILSGCASDPLPPVSIYGLDAVRDGLSADPGRPADGILKMGRIRASRIFKDTGIVYTDASHGRNAYAYSRWADAPVDMLQVVFLDALQGGGRFRAVVAQDSPVRADRLLEATLLDFSHHLIDEGRSEGRIRIRFHLIGPDGRVIDSREFSATAPAPTMTAGGAVEALNRATAEVANRLVEWLGREQ